MRFYAIGDIHGRADLLAEMHKLITEDLRGYAGDSTLVYLGDYVDRGSDTKGVLDLLINSTVGTSRVYLKGNHEEMFLESIAHPKRAQRWLSMGGVKAALSYGVSADDPRSIAKALAVAMPPAHLEFLRTLAVSYPTDRYFSATRESAPASSWQSKMRATFSGSRTTFSTATSSREDRGGRNPQRG